MVNKNDPYNIWNGKNFEFTLNKICKIIFKQDDYVIPEEFCKIANEPVEHVMADFMFKKFGIRVVFDLSYKTSEAVSKEKMYKYIKEGIIVVTNRVFKDSNGKILPTIQVTDVYEAWIALGRYAKKVFQIPTIGITGSVGKTTATMFAECVFNERYNVFVSSLEGRNFNTIHQITNQWILRGGPQFTFHVQECGGELPKSVENSARVIDADGFGILNIDTTQHIATYGTPSALISDKTSFDRVRKNNTFGVINIDDAILKNHNFKSPIITYAIEDKSADYVGKNIVQNGELLEFDIAYKNKCVHIKINIVGKHNVYNALMVFAFAKKYGLADEEIQEGFLKYKSIGIRQNLREVAGRYIYMDAYNASVQSTLSAVSSLKDFNIKSGGRKIAIIGERGTSSDETYEINYNLGKALANQKHIDEFIIVGESKEDFKKNIDDSNCYRDEYRTALFDGLMSSVETDISDNVTFNDNLPLIAEKLKYQTKPGDVILVKGRAGLLLWSVVDIAFGTAYTKAKALISFGLSYKNIENDKIKGEYYKTLEGINLTWGRDEFDNTKLIIDDYVDNKPIVRIGDNAFLNDSQLRMVVFGKHVRAIGDKAFKSCSNLEYLELPKKCCYIGENAFSGCTGLVSVTMLDCWHISKEAFRGCTKLKQVILSEKCVTIESDAFLDCNYLTVLAPEGSYAIQYAKENHIAYEYIDSSEERDKLSENGSRKTPEVYGLEKYEDSFNTKFCNDSEAYSGEDIKLSISFAGDIMIHDEQLNSFLDTETGKFNFDKLFINTKKYFAESNIAIANLETTMGSGEYSGFSCFNTPEEMAEALSKAGFDVIAAANNHIYDTNHNGIIKTKKTLEREGLAVTGICKEYNEKAYVVIERCGLKTAVLNYTYRSSSNDGNITLNNRVLDAESAEFINSFCYETLDKDLEKIKQDIDSARADGANIIIVYYHWGHEYETCSNVIQRYIAYKTALFGADAIIGSHAHVLQEQDEIAIKINEKEKIVPVFYGMGNYCWGGRLPRTGRETVHNGIIGKLDILYNKVRGKVEAINTDYIPLYIKTDYIKDKYDFNILSLDDMEYEEIDAFNLRSSQSVYEIKKQIDDTLCNRAESLKKFDEIVEIPIGERCNLYENKYLGIKGMKLKSENTIVASVFNDGQIVANSVGMAGVTAIDDKHEVDFVVKVITASNNILPTVVDAYNIVPDTYKPEQLKTGYKWGLTEIKLERKTAMAWRKMQIAADKEKISLECIDGYRTNEQQLRRIISYAEKFNSQAAHKRYMPVGCSEHQLGCALDVTNKDTFKYNSSNEETFEWLLDNAYKFGFSIRRSEKNNEEIGYMHLRYIGDNDVAEYLTENNLAVNQYVRDYKYHYDKIANAKAWKNKFLEDKSSSNQLTLLRICEMIGIEVPMGFKEIQNRIIPDIALSDLDVVQGGIYFYDKNLRRATEKCRRAIREGAVLAVTDRQVNDEIGEPLPQIIVEDAFSACVKVGSALRENFDGKVVCVNELGKTRTLRNLLYDITNSVYSVFKNERLADNRINILNSIRTLSNNNEYEIFIQNLRGVYKNYILYNVEMLNPDVVVLASLYDTPPAKYRDYQEYISDIHNMLEYTLNNNGITIVNTDYSELRNYAGRKNVISISAFDKNSDYYIKESSTGFRICYCSIYKKGKRKVKKLKYFKRKNIYKYYILAAYAVSDILNIPESTVINTIEDKFFNKYSKKITFGRLKTLINIYREENDTK